MMRRFASTGTLVAAGVLGGCIAPGERLTFPTAPISANASERRYDVDRDGRADFALLADAAGRFRTLAYDDDQDGTDDRIYHLDETAQDDVPHLIVLMDSIPYEAVAERYSAPEAGWSWFDPPQKVIPPFPTMSPVIFSRMIGVPPMPGAINQYYDRRTGRRVNRIFERTTGDGNAWERRLHYRMKYWENGLSFLYPRRWFPAELARAKAAFDTSPDRVTLVYLASTAGMLNEHGREGVDECLDGLERLALQVLYERRGAVKVSALADHGHNLSSGQRIDLAAMLREAGFAPADRLGSNADVVVELDGLVNYAGVHTRRPAEVAAALAAREEIELAMYVSGEGCIVRSAAGAAEIRHRDGRFAYTPLDYDVLGYAPVIESLRSRGLVDAEGFIAAADWFDATLDHRWPDAPRRIWEGFRIVAVNTPDVMITTRPGYYVGLASFDWWVDMASTHGGLDQVDSATFVLTTTGRATRAMRTEEVIPTIEPRYDPGHLRR